MQKKITESSATYPVGLPPSRKLLKVASGQYRGRLVAVVQTASGDIEYSWADRPYGTWSTPATIASDAADEPCDCLMDTNGNIHVVYSEVTTKYLVTKKLSFSGGSWSIGSKVTVFNGAEAYNPSVTIEAAGTLWVSWSHLNTGSYYLHAKSSTDSGATWGSGPADDGDELSNAASELYSKVVIGTSDIFIVYSYDGSTLSVRSRPIVGGSWTTAVDLASSASNIDDHFDVAVSDNGLLAVAYDQAALKYREYDGAVWSPVVDLDAAEGNSPQVLFNVNVPVVVYLSQYATGQEQLMYTSRETGSFVTPEPLDSGAGAFDEVLVYDIGSSSYNDLTAAAASGTPADVYHSSSSTLLKILGDTVHIGMDRRFRYLRILLSTVGVGGVLKYSYWDGSAWIAFTPAGGAYDFDASDKELLLWNDYDATPDDWQKEALGDDERYWVQIQVTTGFSTGPVGSQITSISNAGAVIVRR
ncbi:MAG: exo-alpha-sialidase [candidate division Zixibacteria bacterium]|nr:exo-alpha-sialidase [candidate division Zixibacteria bacterium]MDH3936084.1 exo-alpha-sialidase [candidate division Zixibacteria bacterium]MDH4032230.1 exo-alpha-sialidase [candidate division Zixibacteria bacterium]